MFLKQNPYGLGKKKRKKTCIFLQTNRFILVIELETEDRVHIFRNLEGIIKNISFLLVTDF